MIPRYQRAYDWKSDSQVGEFIADLIAAAESKEREYLYLGPMIFDSSSDKKKTTISVIDGQQRLTTTLILLMALRDYVRFELSNESVAQSVQQLISNSDALSSKAHHRLIPSPVIANVFPLMSDYAWDGKFPSKLTVNGKQVGIKREVSKVRPIYDFCKAQVQEYAGIDLDKAREFAMQIR